MLLFGVNANPVSIVAVAAAHAAASAALWLWMGTVALGLGFKDKASWTDWNHLEAAIVPPVAMVVTFPGRLLLSYEPDPVTFAALVIANSFIWAVVLVWTFQVLRLQVKQHNNSLERSRDG